MAEPCHTIPAASADDVTFPGYKLAGMKVIDVGADFNHLAHEFVADCERDLDGGTCPGIPIVNMNVGAADAGAEDANENVVDADGGFGYILEPQPFFGMSLDQSLHENYRI